MTLQRCPVHYNIARIQNRPPFSQRQYSEATETASRVFKTVFPFNKLEILPIYHQKRKITLKNTCIFNDSLWEAVMVTEQSISEYEAAKGVIRRGKLEKCSGTVFRNALLSHCDSFQMPQR
ncbi:hypothetical protein E2C01_100134 [Portunus trituberculatus]|uniref:Uncharacterized protein n=1 Tax=Portunus trituberculatus TaxID=210409 RepID=A0A5B7KCI8_PORTR|nr:hypothetical protein [Portunus trituberculatus]